MICCICGCDCTYTVSATNCCCIRGVCTYTGSAGAATICCICIRGASTTVCCIGAACVYAATVEVLGQLEPRIVPLTSSIHTGGSDTACIQYPNHGSTVDEHGIINHEHGSGANKDHDGLTSTACVV